MLPSHIIEQCAYCLLHLGTIAYPHRRFGTGAISSLFNDPDLIRLLSCFRRKNMVQCEHVILLQGINVELLHFLSDTGQVQCVQTPLDGSWHGAGA